MMTTANKLAKRVDLQAADLLPRFIRFEALSLAELTRLADFLFQRDVGDPAFIEDALSEPPYGAGIASPRVLGQVLRRVIDALSESSSLDSVQLEQKNLCRERRAASICLDATRGRKERLEEALIALADDVPDGGYARPATARWLTSIIEHLVDEFDFVKEPHAIHGLNAACNGHRRACARAESGVERLRHVLGYGQCFLWLQLAKRQSQGQQGVPPSPYRGEAAEALLQFLSYLGGDDSSARARFTLAALHAVSHAIFEEDGEVATDIDQCCEESEQNLEPAPDLNEVMLLYTGMLKLYQARGALGSPAGQPVVKPLSRLRKSMIERQLDIEASLKSMPPRPAIDAEPIETRVAEIVGSGMAEREGLALSGGGWRAACFHVGVLARLAERDALRKIDAISCVSGGAVAGAVFAVRLNALLARKHDAEISRRDYIEIALDLVRVMMAVVTDNVRMRALASPVTILKMCFKDDFTYTERIAEILDRHLFAPLVSTHPRFAEIDVDRLGRPAQVGEAMRRPGLVGAIEDLTKSNRLGWPLGPWNLREAPKGEAASFRVDSALNGMRHAKVPELFIITSSLNTGAAFVFTSGSHGERMGEARRISNRPNMKHLRYDNFVAGAAYAPQRLPLSRVVSASASVPGLLPPVLVERSHESLQLALADGGVVDNQGVHELIHYACKRVVVSDASGQLRFDPYPDVSGVTVMMRASDILMERVRELGYTRARESVRANVLTRFEFLHLTKDLPPAPPLNPLEPDDFVTAMYANALRPLPTQYGVVRARQEMLAKVRTDLDCFCELEAYSLMTNGYLQAGTLAANHSSDTQNREAASVDWPFLVVRDDLSRNAPNDRLNLILDTAHRRFFRLPILIARLARQSSKPWIRFLGIGLPAAIVALVGSIAWLAWPALRHAAESPYISWVLLGTIGLAFGVHRLPPSRFKRRVSKALSAPFLIGVMLYAWCVLYIADPLYRRIGRAPRSRPTNPVSSG